MKKSLMILLTLVFFLPASLLTLFHFQPTLLQIPLEKLVNIATGMELRVQGTFQLELSLTPQLVAEGVTLNNPHWTGQTQLAQLGRLELAIDLPALFKDRILIPLLRIDDATVFLQRDEAGNGNWQAPDPKQESDINDSIRIPEINELRLSNIHVEYRQPGMKPVLFELKSSHITLDAQNGAQGEADLLVDGQSYELTISSDMESVFNAPDRAFPLQAVLRGGDAEFDAQGTMGWPLRSADTSLRIRLKGNSLSRFTAVFTGYTLPPSGEFKLESELEASAKRVTLKNLLLSLGQSSLTGEITLATGSNRPRWQAKLNIDRFPDELLQPVSEEKKDPLPPVEATVIDWQLLNSLDAGLALEIGALTFNGEHLEGIRLEASLEQGKLDARLHPTSAFSRRLQGQLQLDANSRQPKFRLRAESDRLRLGDLLRQVFGRPGLNGEIEKLQLDLSGRYQNPLLSGIDTLQLKATSALLTTSSNNEQLPQITLKSVLASLDPKSRGLQLQLEGMLDKQPLRLDLKSGTLTELHGRSRQPLSLELSTGTTQIKGDGEISFPDGTPTYHAKVKIRAGDLRELGQLVLLDLHASGEVEATALLSGNLNELGWKGASIRIGETDISSEGNLSWDGGRLRYSAGAVFEAEHTVLIETLLFPGLPRLGPMTGEINLTGDNRQMALKIPRVRVGESGGEATATIDFSGNRPHVTAEIKDATMQLQDYLAPEQKTDVPASAQVLPGKRLIPDLAIQTAFLHKLDLDVKTHFRQLLYGTADLGEFRVSTRIKNGVLSTDGETRSTYLSRIIYRIEITERDGNAAVSLKAEANDLDYGGLLRILDVSSQAKGKLDFETELQGTGDRLPELLAAGNGTLHISGGPGELNYSVLRLWGGTLAELLIPSEISGREITHVNCLAARYRLNPGIFESEGMVLDSDVATIAGILRVELPSERLQGGLQPKPKGARLFTIDTPVRLSGTLADPKVETLSEGTLLSVGKLAAGIYNPVFLVALFGSVGSGEENPCEAVLEGADSNTTRTKLEKTERTLEKGLRGLFGKGKNDHPENPLVPAGK